MAVNPTQAALKHDLPQIGLPEEAHDGVVRVLQTVLADEHIIYIKLRNYHWNVSGPQFHSLHELFEEQYTAVARFIDETAERIVQYGAVAPGTLAEFQRLSRLEEFPGQLPEPHAMVANIVRDHETLIRHLRDDIETVGSEYKDVGSEDFLTGLLQEHQEQNWMARAMIKGKPLIE